MKPNLFYFIYFSPEGRITRKTYWLSSSLIAFILWVNEYYLSSVNPYLELILMVALLYPAFMLNIKRCHDLDKTGYFSLLLFIPVVNLWPLIELAFFRGNTGDNRFGNEEYTWHRELGHGET